MKITAGSLLTLGTIAFPSDPGYALPSSLFDNVILRPIKAAKKYTVAQVAGVKARDVFFPSSNGRMLHGWYFKQPEAQRTVLLSHGIGGNVSSRVDLVELYLKAGASVFIYDYQGYGRSSGTASLKHIVDDGHSAYTHLTSELGADPNQIILAGESLGTGVTCALSTRVKCAALVLQSPFSSLAKRVSEIVPFFKNKPTWIEPTSGLENDLVLSKAHPPVLIVHGEKDSTVPVSHAHQLFQSAIGEKQLLVVNGAGHTGDPLLMNSEQYLDAVKTFMHTISPAESPTHVTHNAEQDHPHIVTSMPLGL